MLVSAPFVSERPSLRLEPPSCSQTFLPSTFPGCHLCGGFTTRFTGWQECGAGPPVSLLSVIKLINVPEEAVRRCPELRNEQKQREKRGRDTTIPPYHPGTLGSHTIPWYMT